MGAVATASIDRSSAPFSSVGAAVLLVAPIDMRASGGISCARNLVLAKYIPWYKGTEYRNIYCAYVTV
jgi:hypothetical protein